MRHGIEGYGWMLFREEEDKRIASLSSFNAGWFAPIFPTRSQAKWWRDERLQMPHLKIIRMRVQPSSD